MYAAPPYKAAAAPVARIAARVGPKNDGDPGKNSSESAIPIGTRRHPCQTEPGRSRKALSKQELGSAPEGRHRTAPKFYRQDRSMITLDSKGINDVKVTDVISIFWV